MRSVRLALLVSLVPAGGVAAWLASVQDTAGTYLLLALATLPTSELAPIFGGLAAYEGVLRFAPVVAAVTLGGWLGTGVLYWLGRSRWEALRRRWPAVRTTGTVALRIVRRNPQRASFLVRFLLGARILLPIACGAAKVPAPTYLLLSFLGSLAWTVTYVLVGAIAGEAAEQVLAHLEQLEGVLTALGVVAVIGAAWWWRRRQQRRAARRARGRAGARG